MMRKVLFLTVVMWVLVYVGALNLTDDARGDEGWQEISASEVKTMIENGDAVVIHVLSEIEYNMQHITGSINIPIIKVKSSKKLPQDKNTPLVFYCMGKR